MPPSATFTTWLPRRIEQQQAPVDPLDEVKLELVAVRIRQPQCLVGLWPWQVRLDVTSASDYDRVDDVKLVVDRSSTRLRISGMPPAITSGRWKPAPW